MAQRNRMADLTTSFIEQIYEFSGRFGALSRCGLLVRKGSDRHVAIATELFEENPGTSVTEFCSELAAMIVRDFGLDPAKFVFIDHCPDRGSRLECYRETFDIVHFRHENGRFFDPEWERIDRGRVEELIAV